jgi:hypothetical protein
MQRRAASSTASHEAATAVNDVIRSPGRPLDPTTRAFFETRFDEDFGHVRIHADGGAARSAAAIAAHAYTVGSDIVFNTGKFEPNSHHGRELLAHELTHVVQQSGQPKVISRDDAGVAAPQATPRTAHAPDIVRALADRFETYASTGEAALSGAAISGGDADRIRGDLTRLRAAIAGMRGVAQRGDDKLSLALLASFRSPHLAHAAHFLHRAAPATPAVAVSETAPAQLATSSLDATANSAVEREARQIGRIIASLTPVAASPPDMIVRRQAAEVLEGVEQLQPVFDQLIDLAVPIGTAVNDNGVAVAVGDLAVDETAVAVGTALTATVGMPVAVVAGLVIVAALAGVAIWYYMNESEASSQSSRQPHTQRSPRPAPNPGPLTNQAPVKNPCEDCSKSNWRKYNTDFMREKLAQIRENPDHPLKFLVDAAGNWQSRSSTVESGVHAGHRYNRLACQWGFGKLSLAIEEGWQNIYDSETDRSLGVSKATVVIGGVEVDYGSALEWQKNGELQGIDLLSLLQLPDGWMPPACK